MKRFLSVFLFLALAAAVFGGIFTYVRTLREREREEAVSARTLTLSVYTDLPAGAVTIFDAPFAAETGVRLSVTELTRTQLLEKLQAGERPDLYLFSQDALHELAEKGALSPYISDRTDTVLNGFKDEEGRWTGALLNPAVFAVNTEFARFHPAFSYTFDEVFHRQSVRLVLADCIAADFAEDSLMALVEKFGVEETFARLKDAAPHVVQYGKYLSTPANMAAMDKCDLGVSGYNEARRVRQEGLPIRILYPEDGTWFYLYGLAIDAETPRKKLCADFIDWFLSTDAREAVLNENKYFYIYTNDTRMPEDDAGKKPDFWPLEKRYTKEGKKALLDRWIQEIRFGK